MSEIRTVNKYPIHGEGADIQMPLGARVLCVQSEDNVPAIWALVDPNAELERRHFRLMSTGAAFASDGLTYIGTYQNSWFVGHVFEQTV